MFLQKKKTLLNFYEKYFPSYKIDVKTTCLGILFSLPDLQTKHLRIYWTIKGIFLKTHLTS